MVGYLFGYLTNRFSRPYMVPKAITRKPPHLYAYGAIAPRKPLHLYAYGAIAPRKPPHLYAYGAIWLLETEALPTNSANFRSVLCLQDYHHGNIRGFMHGSTGRLRGYILFYSMPHF